MDKESKLQSIIIILAQSGLETDRIEETANKIIELFEQEETKASSKKQRSKKPNKSEPEKQPEKKSNTAYVNIPGPDGDAIPVRVASTKIY